MPRRMAAAPQFSSGMLLATPSRCVTFRPLGLWLKILKRQDVHVLSIPGKATTLPGGGEDGSRRKMQLADQKMEVWFTSVLVYTVWNPEVKNGNSGSDKGDPKERLGRHKKRLLAIERTE